jgi:hypothetical protein
MMAENERPKTPLAVEEIRRDDHRDSAMGRM